MNEYQLPVDRLGIPAFTTFTEGVHGIGWSGDRHARDVGEHSVLYLTGTQFPQAYGLAESWDPAALQHGRRDDRLRGARLERRRGAERAGPRRRPGRARAAGRPGPRPALGTHRGVDTARIRS